MLSPPLVLGRGLIFLLPLGGCFPVPGVPPGGGVTFCLRAKALRSDNRRESVECREVGALREMDW